MHFSFYYPYLISVNIFPINGPVGVEEINYEWQQFWPPPPKTENHVRLAETTHWITPIFWAPPKILS